MADRITVNPEDMVVAINAYESQKEVKMEAINSMKNAVDSMDGSWDGPASELFMEAFNDLYYKMLQTEERMQDAIDELKAIQELADIANWDVINDTVDAQSMNDTL